jgi:hypothetical protein
MTFYQSTPRSNGYRSNGFRPAPLAPGRTFTPSTTKPASPAAMGFLDSLLRQRDLTGITAPVQGLLTLRAAHPAELTAAQASFCIDAIKALPFLQSNVAPGAKDQTPAPLAEVGFYLLDGEVWKVRASKEDDTRRYALKLVITTGEKGRFEYVAGAIRNLRLENRLTLEEAKAIGHQQGICCVCGANLSDGKSVAAGIGPTCARKLG